MAPNHIMRFLNKETAPIISDISTEQEAMSNNMDQLPQIPSLQIMSRDEKQQSNEIDQSMPIPCLQKMLKDEECSKNNNNNKNQPETVSIIKKSSEEENDIEQVLFMPPLQTMSRDEMHQRNNTNDREKHKHHSNDIESCTYDNVKVNKEVIQKYDTALLINALKLLYGAGGIFSAYLCYGSLQEDVYNHVGSTSYSKFKHVWFLQVLEAFSNVLVGCIGWFITSKNLDLPQKQFMIIAVSSGSSRAFTALSLASGLSFSIATMAKSAKMAPVMAGSVLLGGDMYSLRDCYNIGMIIFGTAILTIGKSKGGESQSTPMGLLFIILSLTMDGITGGIQKRILNGRKHKPYDFMLFTSLYMMMIAMAMSIITRDFITGIAYCRLNPEIVPMIVKFSLCSAIGQSFIFYTVVHFDPLICGTVTTTRKIVSVLMSIFLKGNQLTNMSWVGVIMAIGGIFSEIGGKISRSCKGSC